MISTMRWTASVADALWCSYALQFHLQLRIARYLWHQNAPMRTILTKQEAMPSKAWLPVFEPGAGRQRLRGMQGEDPCPESRGGALWPSEVSKAQRPGGFDTLYWVLPVETGALRGNESNSVKEIRNPTKEKEVTAHRKSEATGIPSQWPRGKTRRL